MSWWNGTHRTHSTHQCCRLLTEVFGQSSGKSRPPEKTNLNLSFEGVCGLQNFFLLCLCARKKCNMSFIYLELQRIRAENQTFKKFGPFWKKFQPKFGCLFRLPFIRPFLSYATEQSANWQHWPHTWTGRVTNKLRHFAVQSITTSRETKISHILCWWQKDRLKKMLENKIGI